MKMPFILAVLIFVPGATQAGSISIDINGRTIHIAAPRDCADSSCLSVSIKGSPAANAKSGNIDLADLVSTFMPKSGVIDTPDASVVNAPVPANPSVPAPTVTPKPTPDPKVARLEEQPAESGPAFDPASPVGFWSTEKKEGVVHIMACSDKLCGYKFDPATKTDGVEILINMTPIASKKWGGTIHDPTKGGTYSSTLALNGPTSLRVEGCAFGGMICGGQTWKRL